MSDPTTPSDPFAQPPAGVAAPSSSEAQPEAQPAAQPQLASARRLSWKPLAAVAVVIAMVVVGVVLFSGGDDDGKSGGSGGSGAGGGDAPSGEWHLVRYSFVEPGAIEVLDDQMEVVRSIPFTTDGAPAISRAVGRYVPTEPEGTTMEVFDLADGSSRVVELPAEGLSVDRAVLAAGSSQAILASAATAPLVLVDLAEGSATVLGNAERYYPVGLRQGHALFMAADTSGTVVVPIADPAGWWEVPGPVASIRGRETLVLGMVDNEPAVRHFDGSEQQGATVAMKAPQLGGLLTDSGAMTVDTGGGLWTIDFESGESDPLGTLGIGVDGVVPIADDRVMTWAAAGSRVVLADGTVTQEVDPVEDSQGEVQPFVPVSGGIGTTCLTVQPGPRPAPENSKAITVDIATGEQLVRFQATPVGFTPDGCSAISIGDPTEVMLNGALVEFDLDRVQIFSPDLTEVVGVDLGDQPRFFLVDVASGERTELSEGAYFWAQF